MTHHINFTEKIQLATIVHEENYLQAFPGRPHENMQALLGTGRTPLSAKDLMEQRLIENKDTETLRKNPYTTSTLVFRNSVGEVIITSYERNQVAQNIVNKLNTASHIQHGSLVATNDIPNVDELYETIRDGGARIILPTSVVRNLEAYSLNEQKTREQVLDFLAEGNTRIAQDYWKLVIQTPLIIGDQPRGGLYLPEHKGGRLITLGSLDYSGQATNTLSFDGYDAINSKKGCLIGKLQPTTTAHTGSHVEGIVNIINNPDLNREGMIREVKKYLS